MKTPDLTKFVHYSRAYGASIETVTQMGLANGFTEGQVQDAIADYDAAVAQDADQRAARRGLQLCIETNGLANVVRALAGEMVSMANADQRPVDVTLSNFKDATAGMRAVAQRMGVGDGLDELTYND